MASFVAAQTRATISLISEWGEQFSAEMDDYNTNEDTRDADKENNSEFPISDIFG